MTRVELHIDRLVLDGMDPRHARLIGDALRLRLQQRLAAGPLPEVLRTAGMRGVLDAGAIGIGPDVQPRTAADALAGAIWRGITR